MRLGMGLSNIASEREVNREAKEEKEDEIEEEEKEKMKAPSSPDVKAPEHAEARRQSSLGRLANLKK